MATSQAAAARARGAGGLSHPSARSSSGTILRPARRPWCAYLWPADISARACRALICRASIVTAIAVLQLVARTYSPRQLERLSGWTHKKLACTVYYVIGVI